MIDLNICHHALHRVTGSMATHFNRATPEDLTRWVAMLRKVASEMEEAATMPPICEDCGINRSDPPSQLCPGCRAYCAHTGQI
jgi:predicted Zn-ribbon and HTH transcriptional regulator